MLWANENWQSVSYYLINGSHCFGDCDPQVIDDFPKHGSQCGQIMKHDVVENYCPEGRTAKKVGVPPLWAPVHSDLSQTNASFEAHRNLEATSRKATTYGGVPADDNPIAVLRWLSLGVRPP